MMGVSLAAFVATTLLQKFIISLRLSNHTQGQFCLFIDCLKNADLPDIISESTID